MTDYYDKEKFTGNRNPSGSGAPGGQDSRYQPPPRRDYQTPPPPGPSTRKYSKKENNAGWYSWPVIILLFALGAWPVALAFLLLNLYGDAKRSGSKSGSSAGQKTYTYNSQAQSAVDRAMKRAEERMGKAENKVERAFDRAGESVDQAVERAMRQMEQTLDRTARQVHQSTKRNWQSAPPPKVKAAKPAKEKKPKAKPAGVLLRIFGLVALFIGFCIGADCMSELFQGYGLDFDNFFASAGFLLSGGLMFFRGQYLNKMSRRSQRYILAIGNTDVMPIEEIAKRVNRKPHEAEKELQKLIDKGYLGEDAYIDYEKGYFLRFGATLEEEEPEEEEPVSRSAPEMTPKEAQEGYSGILRNIRHANDRIADPELSRKIERLEQISGLIFKEVEEHPEKRNSIHTFFDYYLPTTQKLLDTYADFEETGVEGENLREAKARIEQTMDLIVDGFEHQLDQLYSSDAMDVASDIKVMEAMLKRDTASAAKDFGYAEKPMVRPKSDKKQDDGGTMQTMQ